MILQKIRAGESADSIVRRIKDGDLLVQLSLDPQNQTRYEFPHLRAMPAYLQTPENTYLESFIFEETSLYDLPIAAASTGLKSFHSPYMKPYHAAKMVDHRLANARPSKWTSISSDDRLLRRLLEAYFLHQYPRYVPFHKDFFLEDMNTGRHQHCSSLLVNAVLAAACVGTQSFGLIDISLTAVSEH